MGLLAALDLPARESLAANTSEPLPHIRERGRIPEGRKEAALMKGD